MLVVGVTGGIGSGKTTVTDLFAGLGVAVIDADEIAHKLVTPGSDASLQIANVFGKEFFSESGELDRDALREVVFHDHFKKRELEAILHPRIRQTIETEVNQLDDCYCLVVIPLLVETGGNPLLNRVLVVDCPEQQQVERVMRRSQLPAEQVRAILDNQATREARLDIADDVVENTGGLKDLEKQVKNLHERYLEICQQT